MRHSRFISSTPAIRALLASLLFTILAVALNADDFHSWYDASKEVTLTGVVSGVFPPQKTEPGMIRGSHLMVETAFGRLDASLGRFGLEGRGALSVTPGQQIELIGVMMTIRDKEVFVVRSAKANGKIYTIRNERGIEVSPQARERAFEKGVAL